jgi:hypothetical protein
MIVALLLWVTAIRGEDILLDHTTPIPCDPSYHVASYYRNEPNTYLFTVAYRALTPDTLERYYTKISFNLSHAGYAHDQLERWLRRAYRTTRGRIPVEPFEIVPRIPMPQRSLTSQTVYLIYPQTHTVEQGEEVLEKWD